MTDDPAPEPRQRLYLHIGLPKSGSTYLQALLGTHREQLKTHGFVYPWLRQEAMFHAAVEMAGNAERWGLDRDEISGTLAGLLRRGRRVGGTVVISHEIFSAADADQVEAIMGLAEDFEVHVVLTVRDLARTLPADWQEQVKNGSTATFASYADDVLACTGEGEQADHRFMPAQNLGLVLDVWGAHVPQHRIHVVPAPQPGAPRTLLWERFADAVGLPPDAVDPGAVVFSNESLGTPQIALLREVLLRLDGELAQPWRRRVLKRWFAQRLLAEVSTDKPVLPVSYVAPLTTVARAWCDRLAAGDYQVHGDLDELLPRPTPPHASHPDDVTDAQKQQGLDRVLAQMLLRVRDLHLEVEDLTAQRDALRATLVEREGQVAGLREWQARRWYRRLRRPR